MERNTVYILYVINLIYNRHDQFQTDCDLLYSAKIASNLLHPVPVVFLEAEIHLTKRFGKK